MEWHYDDRLPIYTQLTELLERAIVSGEYCAGDRLPSVREMALEAGVNPNTMQRTLQELERRGLVYTQRNNGRFVTEDPGAIERAGAALAKTAAGEFLQKMASLGFSREAAIRILEEYKEEGTK